MSEGIENYYETQYESQEEKKKKKRTKYETVIIEKTDKDYIDKLSKKHTFQTKGKAIMIVKEQGRIWKQIYDSKFKALEDSVIEKGKSNVIKVKLLLEI